MIPSHDSRSDVCLYRTHTPLRIFIPFSTQSVLACISCQCWTSRLDVMLRCSEWAGYEWKPCTSSAVTEHPGRSGFCSCDTPTDSSSQRQRIGRRLHCRRLRVGTSRCLITFTSSSFLNPIQVGNATFTRFFCCAAGRVELAALR